MYTKEEKNEGIVRIHQKNGPDISFFRENNIKIIQVDGLFFKNLSRSGKLEKYEDWRLTPKERAVDLVRRLTPRQMAGLMTCSCTFTVPASGKNVLHGRPQTYSGKLFEESGQDVSTLSDQLKQVIADEAIRCIYVGGVQSSEAFIKWSNNLQMLAEGQEWAIPVCCATDPRHGYNSRVRKNFSPGEDISIWPEGIAMAAAFDPKLVYKAAKIQSKEYRALGLTHVLGPQIDIGSDPRWSRYQDTYGEDSALITELGRAFIDGFQTTENSKNGWGKDSVLCIAKHWPGGGTGEGGRDAHYDYGKYGVYPGNNFSEHLKPFIYGAFCLKGPTKKAAGVMPYYLIPYGQSEENTGCGFNRYITRTLLKETYKYDGIVCSDWEILEDDGENVHDFAGKCWGVENLTKPYRCIKALEAGVNMFGGENRSDILADVYEYGVKTGDQEILQAFKTSCEKILISMIEIGLFEDPYLDAENSLKILGSQVSAKAGRDAQKKAVILLKNKGKVLPLPEGSKVYVPYQYDREDKKTKPAQGIEALKRYFHITSSAHEADCAVVFIEEGRPDPIPVFACYDRGYSFKDFEQGGSGYVPISLQYEPYKAKYARRPAIARPDNNKAMDRSYKDKWAVNDTKDFEILKSVYKEMMGKPIIVVLTASNPCCVHEIEPMADCFVLDFHLDPQIYGELCAGKFNPSGLLPFQLPKDMDAVERQHEDVSHDMECYVDEEGHCYDFGFGMSFNGVIYDERYQRFVCKQEGAHV